MKSSLETANIMLIHRFRTKNQFGVKIDYRLSNLDNAHTVCGAYRY